MTKYTGVQQRLIGIAKQINSFRAKPNILSVPYVDEIRAPTVTGRAAQIRQAQDLQQGEKKTLPEPKSRKIITNKLLLVYDWDGRA